MHRPPNLPPTYRKLLIYLEANGRRNADKRERQPYVDSKRAKEKSPPPKLHFGHSVWGGREGGFWIGALRRRGGLYGDSILGRGFGRQWGRWRMEKKESTFSVTTLRQWPIRWIKSIIWNRRFLVYKNRGYYYYYADLISCFNTRHILASFVLP